MEGIVANLLRYRHRQALSRNHLSIVVPYSSSCSPRGRSSRLHVEDVGNQSGVERGEQHCSWSIYLLILHFKAWSHQACI